MIAGTGLVRRFGRKTALDHVSVAWGTGVHGVLGPNGAGKTTLLRILALIDDPSAGQLTVFGRPVSALAGGARGRIGYLPQALGVPGMLTPRDLVTYVVLLRGLDKGVEGSVESALDRAGARSVADRRLRTLSGGERQRAGIAAAIAGEPDLVLLDEPTAGLDPQQRVSFRSLLQDLGGSSTVVLSTHLVEDVALGCDTVTVLKHGRVAFDGRVDQLAAMGHPQASRPGVSPLELGYLSVMDSSGDGHDA